MRYFTIFSLFKMRYFTKLKDSECSIVLLAKSSFTIAAKAFIKKCYCCSIGSVARRTKKQGDRWATLFRY